jgi:Ca2+-binding RTX toxin-like protein
MYVPHPSPVYDGFTVNGGKFVTMCVPIVFDLDGDGVEYRTLDAPVLLDADGDGRFERSAWVSPDDGLLIYDQNGDGIGQHNEWVLTHFDHHAHTDLEALRSFDSNKDGLFNAADALFASFKIGRDLNQNGVFEANEVQSLAAYGITQINLQSGVQTISTWDDPAETAHGVYTFASGQFVRSNGSVGQFTDVALEKEEFSQQVYSDTEVTVVSYGGAHAWLQTGTGGVIVDMASTTYAGFGNFIDFFGNSGSDYVVGSAAANRLFGGDGADTLLGGGGDDIIVGDHADFAYGYIHGGDGYDTLAYTSAESLYLDVAAASFEMVLGGSGDDVIYGSTAELNHEGIIFIGGAGNDSLYGGNGDDHLIGGTGADMLSGGAGTDFLVIDGSDSWTSIYGGTSSGDRDTVTVDGSTGFYFGNLYQQGVESFFGGGGDDIVYASVTGSGYAQQKATNTLDGGAGNDYLYGGAGKDTYFWNRGGGSDTFVDKDYDEQQGDIISLGAGITAQDVWVSYNRTSNSLHFTISGPGGGSIAAHGFAGQYGVHDLLFVDNKFYDLNYVKMDAGYGVSLATLAPITPYTGGGSTGGGGGGTGGGPGGGYTYEPPLVLDLDGDGFELIAPKKSGIYFDWNGDGIKEETGWVGPGDGILVMDRNGDGAITNGSEVRFGVWNGRKEPFTSDLEGLRAMDSNGNGSLDPGDAAYAQLSVWRDANSNAVVDAGEMLSLAQMEVEAIGLGGFQSSESDRSKGNIILGTTDVVFADGGVTKAADVLFAYDGRHDVRNAMWTGDGHWQGDMVPPWAVLP